MQSYPLKFTDTFERDDPDCHRRSNVCSDFKTGRSCVIGGMTLHCGLPAGKLKLAVILVQRSSMRVTKGTSRMRERWIPGHFSSPTWPGYEAKGHETMHQ